MTASTSAPSTGLLARTFRSLRLYNYRLYFFSQVVSMSGTWMQSVAQNWLVLSLTGSALDLGITVGLQFGPVLVFGAWGGTLADRVDKRKLLLATQAAPAVLALVLGGLVAAGVVTVWMIWVLAGLTGTATALGIPALQSFLYEMVGPDDLANAVGLNSVIINSSRIVGPAIGAVLIARVGVAPCFFINAASFVAVIVALLMMRTAELRRSKPVPRERGQVREGFRYVWRTQSLRVPLVMLAVISTLAYNYSVVLPLLTRSVFGRGGGSYGALSAAMGVGALAGALLMASRGRPSRRLLVGGAFAFGLATVALALVPGYYAGLALLVLIGVTAVLYLSTTNALLQLNAVDALRGRVMALWSIVFLGSTPIGGPITGLLVRGLGVRAAIGVGGAATLVAAAGGLLALRRSQVVEDGVCEAPACLPDGPAPGDALGEAVEVGSPAPAVAGLGGASGPGLGGASGPGPADPSSAPAGDRVTPASDSR
jgi:MFS family permease